VSEADRPISAALRGIGSDRNLSARPVSASRTMASPVTGAVSTTFWIMIPGMRNCR
jgi:hypothetical protein